jgi:hypothetical protein
VEVCTCLVSCSLLDSTPMIAIGKVGSDLLGPWSEPFWDHGDGALLIGSCLSTSQVERALGRESCMGCCQLSWGSLGQLLVKQSILSLWH